MENTLKISLKAARTNANMTQSYVAENIGVSPVAIYNWESGRSYPAADKFNELCQLYGISMDDISLPEKLRN